jgi:hypothetical protein
VYLALIEDDCTSIEDHLACQSNQRNLEASLFVDIRKGISINVEFNELYTLDRTLVLLE